MVIYLVAEWTRVSRVACRSPPVFAILPDVTTLCARLFVQSLAIFVPGDVGFLEAYLLPLEQTSI